ncbi:MAG: TM2 domain-containing protein [Paludibacteraceae bacterium]|nr:TM2 domain-containing protein [Paludibacteraceae bacterium]
MKSKMMAAILTFFLGGIGVGNFYLGNKTKGLVQLVLFVAGFFTFGIAWIPLGLWVLVEFVKLLVMTDVSFNEKYNKNQINNQ